MDVRPRIKSLMDAIEGSVSQELLYRREIEILIELTEERGMRQTLDDILFDGKFIAGAYAILTREGINSQETDKLSVEFKTTLEKITTLLKTAVKEAPGDAKELFMKKFFVPTQAGMASLIGLCNDLAYVKNFSIDHKGILQDIRENSV